MTHAFLYDRTTKGGMTVNSLERLEQELADLDVVVVWSPVGQHNGVYGETEQGEKYICINPILTQASKLSTLAHEAGHAACGLQDTPDRNENKAERWAVRKLIHPREIIEATVSGAQSYYDLADYLNLDYEFVKNSIPILAQMHGREILLGKYKLHLMPIYVEDLETGQFWPDN